VALESVGAAEQGIRTWCVAWLAKELKLPAHRIDTNATFARIGMDSAMSVIFMLDLEEWLQVQLSPDLVFEHPSIAELAHHIVTNHEVTAALGR
jgi:acyl carrier protein